MTCTDHLVYFARFKVCFWNLTGTENLSTLRSADGGMGEESGQDRK